MLNERARRIRLVITDNDGVLTDGTVFVGEAGERLKAYSVKDGMGVALLREAGIETAILTREGPALVAPRAEKLGIRLWSGVRDKRAHLTTILAETSLTPDVLVYIGDDVNDLALLRTIGEVGLTAAPADAVPEVQRAVHFLTAARGGRGAFREVADWLLRLRAGEQEDR
ncbi:MAG TPA: 3-deoxy-D-manno-octulosonate 8-phosphate phosphatase [Kofleriaceae bacterium]|jgi:3-deoxy-D-manno-octulosonate 8-phosphate phosphatase (KDO 8-P phosphatase)